MIQIKDSQQDPGYPSILMRNYWGYFFSVHNISSKSACLCVSNSTNKQKTNKGIYITLLLAEEVYVHSRCFRA